MGLGAVADFCPENPETRAQGYFLMSRVQNVLPPELGPHRGRWGQCQACSRLCWRPCGHRARGADGGRACSAFRVGEAGVALADMPEFWWADKQVKPVITGKRPGTCVDRPPGAQAGGLLTREGPRVWTPGAKSHQGGGGVVT